MLRHRSFAVLLTMVALFVGGCSHVSPYQREYLARPGMDTKREAKGDSFHAHVRDAREGATGGSESAGGGCGCN